MSEEPRRPLADSLRPRNLDEFYGQRHLLGEGKPLRQAVTSGQIHSMLLWGPPGTGKTTLARIIAAQSGAQFLSISAVLAGVRDIRSAVEKAKKFRAEQGGQTIFFVDEAHRFNKAQQDAFLPYVEDGTITFIGATTENPSFEINNALLSRTRVYVLKALDASDIKQIVDRALMEPERGLGGNIAMAEELRLHLATAADGDARRALNLLEITAALLSDEEGLAEIDADLLEEVLAGGVSLRFDKGGDAFYDEISALHKSVRGSNPDAALYWLTRMLEGGCHPPYLARRLIRMASEDIGNADPRALQIATQAGQAFDRLGSPEGELALAQAAVYLACAAKSDAVYRAFKAARQDARRLGSLEVPMHLRNAPTKLMSELGHGAGYRHAHDEPGAYAAGEDYFPEGMGTKRYYQPVNRGLEIRIAEKLNTLRDLDCRQGNNKT